MKKHIGSVAVLALVLALAGSFPALASGGKNAYNPSGSPADETFETPYANTGGVPMPVFCAEDGTLGQGRLRRRFTGADPRADGPVTPKGCGGPQSPTWCRSRSPTAPAGRGSMRVENPA